MGSMLVQTYDTHRSNAELQLLNGNYAAARESFLDAADAADKISKQAVYVDIREQYARNAKQMLSRAQNDCNANARVAVVPKAKPEPEKKPTKEAIIDKSLLGFCDIAGLDDVKSQLRVKVLYPLKYPNVNNHYKRSQSTTMQIMLFGEPGCGKTMVSEAICVELGMSMHRASAGDLVSSLLGESSKNLMEFLAAAQADESERILIFIDEFDAIAGKRGGGGGDSASGEMNMLVNTLLQGVDNIVKTNQNKLILFVVTTNLPWKIDPALLRGQRFDTQIYVGVPDAIAIEFLVDKHMAKAPIADDVDMEVFKSCLKGYSAADIKTICEKVTDEPMRRAYEKLEAECAKLDESEVEAYILEHTKYPTEKVTVADMDKVLLSYRNTITQEMHKNYEDYMLGKKVDDWG